MSDILDQLKAERKQSILRRGESYCEFDVYCPYCVVTQNEVWEMGLMFDDWQEVECEGCEQHFMAKSEMRYSTRKCK